MPMRMRCIMHNASRGKGPTKTKVRHCTVAYSTVSNFASSLFGMLRQLVAPSRMRIAAFIQEMDYGNCKMRMRGKVLCYVVIMLF